MNHFSPLRALLSHAPLPSLGLAGLAAFLSSLCSLLLLAASAYLIASAALHPPLHTLALAITLVRACGLGRAVFRYLDRLLSHRAVFHVQEKLQLRLYEKAAALLPLREAGVRQADFLHQLADGCDALRDCYLRAFTPPFPPLILCLMVCFSLFPVLGTGVLLLPLLWLLHLLLPLLSDSENFSRHPSINYRNLLSDMQEGSPELISAGSTAIAAQKLHAASLALGSSQKQRELGKNQMDVLLLLLSDLLLLILFFQLGSAALESRMRGIDLAVCLLALQTVLAEFRPLPEAMRTGKHGMAAAGAILRLPQEELPSSPPRNAVPFRSPAPLLSVRGLGFSYRPGLPVFRDVHFSLQPGEKLAIIGESGCGKTTLGYLLLRLWDADEGSIELRGRDYRLFSPGEIRSAFAPCLQGEYVFHHSIRENFLRLHPDISEDSLWDALSTAHLKEEVLALPNGLDASLGENGCLLSCGQRQRLLIALALASPAPILLLDEPTAGLDKKTAHVLMDGILSHLKGRALIIITHDMVLADRMDRIYRMDPS